ncbi:MAG TPA: T9SS type A sorting domain-containing protein [Agriterribacter sp.]|nr:T9SS type A sorting domain-containing protein [Agriterribacter sp.]
MSSLVRNICLLVLPGMLCLLAPAAGTGQESPLPLRFSSFEADIFNKNAIQLKWTIAGETADSIHFIVERSTDGIIFQPLYTTIVLPGPGAAHYRYTDHFVLTDSAFYRVAFSEQGEGVVSAVRKIQFPVKPKVEVMIMPNPVFNNAALIINDEKLGDISCILYDMTGKSIRTYQIRKTTVYMQQILDMYSVPKGEYILSIRGASINESKRILKQ